MISTHPSQGDLTQYTTTTDEIDPSPVESASNESLEWTMPAEGEDVSKEALKLAEVQRRRVDLFEGYVSAPSGIQEYHKRMKDKTEQCISLFHSSTAQQKKWMDELEANGEITIPANSKDAKHRLSDTSSEIRRTLTYSKEHEEASEPVFTLTSLQRIVEVHQYEKTIREYLVEKGKQPYLTWSMPECE